MARQTRRKKKTVVLKSNEYQPSKAELEETLQIDASPEALARAVVRDVNLRFVK